MTDIWIFKQDGTIQCRPEGEGEITLAVMRKGLEELIGSENVLDEEKRQSPTPIITICGAPTARVNAYRITPEGLRRLFTGVAGPNGFALYPFYTEKGGDATWQEGGGSTVVSPSGDPIIIWPASGKGGPIVPWPSFSVTKPQSDDRWVPWPMLLVEAAKGDPEKLASALTAIISNTSAVGNNPTTLTGLIGKLCRVYKQGDAIAFDYMQGRVNIVLNDAQCIVRIWFG
ncbi:hypothetical protein DEM27_06415 [Metarhizobium album]|uniref:Uncharacterized protein n=1 Tax=Metarhizobium album TaxID=2182425 RepID=A0A2U2DVE5_9HYPH|nr:hypothetical protein [Rhizobium album]PWE57266.1 hypothetical protein DEM27_06415 [Rhizobium album]